MIKEFIKQIFNKLTSKNEASGLKAANIGNEDNLYEALRPILFDQLNIITIKKYFGRIFHIPASHGCVSTCWCQGMCTSLLDTSAFPFNLPETSIFHGSLMAHRTDQLHEH